MVREKGWLFTKRDIRVYKEGNFQGEEGRWEVGAKVRALTQEVQWLGHECASGNQNRALLEDRFEWEEDEMGWLCNQLQVGEYKATLLHRRLAQAEQQWRDLATDRNTGLTGAMLLL